LEGPTDRPQIILVTNHGILAATERHIELTFAVYSIQAIVAGPIQENRAGSPLDWATFFETPPPIPPSNLVEVSLLCLVGFVAAEFFNQFINLIPNDLITGHQFFIQIIKNYTIANPSLIVKVEEYSPSTDERFNIPVEVKGEEWLKLFQQLALAPCPLHKRPNLWFDI
jgi:hypothetical protein